MDLGITTVMVPPPINTQPMSDNAMSVTTPVLMVTTSIRVASRVGKAVVPVVPVRYCLPVAGRFQVPTTGWAFKRQMTLVDSMVRKPRKAVNKPQKAVHKCRWELYIDR